MDRMERLLYIVSSLYLLYVPMKQSLHMFQQNRYRMDRYRVWLRSAWRNQRGSLLKMFLCFLLCYGLLFVPHDHLPDILLIMLLFIYGYILQKLEEEREYRKPLVMTGRVRRLFLCYDLLYLMVLVMLVRYGNSSLRILCVPWLYFSPWLAVTICGMLMMPIEHKIRMHYVKDARKILAAYPHLFIVGITGSYGKTSVKNILHALLKDSCYTLMTPYSYNNLMGITLTIRTRLQRLHEVFLCEMGADHVGEIKTLMKFVRPQYGVVTAVGPQHLQTFGSIENILQEKMQMIEQLPVNGIGFLNKDNAYIRSYKVHNHCDLVWFGIKEPCDYQAVDLHYSPQGSTFQILHEGKRYPFHTRLLGEHNVLNILCAIAVARTFDVPWILLQQEVAALPYVEHRLEVRHSAAYTILDNAYNSNPTGAAYALDVLKQMPHMRFLVTPGFIDLGEMQEEEQFRFGKKIATSCDTVILVGKKQTASIQKGLEEMSFPSDHVYIVSAVQEAFALLRKLAKPEDTVLLENDLPDAFNH